jgi:acyl-CoA synthetase (AMP-forming)/AMP-acid ligase II
MPGFENPDWILTDVLKSHGKWRGDKKAVVCGDDFRTWARFDRNINRVANGLIARGLQKGDKVSLLMSNCIEMLEILFGAVRAGGVIVPLSAMVTGPSLSRMIQNSDSRFLFVKDELVEVIDPFRAEFENIAPENYFTTGAARGDWRSYNQWLADQSDQPVGVPLVYEDHFNIMYTSGTTGLPKGILHTHHNRFHFAAMFGVDFLISSSAVSVITTALYANGTWLVMLPTIFAGGTLVVMPSFDVKGFLELVQAHRATHTFMVPAQFQLLLEDPAWRDYDLNSMKVWVAAGSPMRRKTKEQVVYDLPGDLIELWGLTEGVATTLKPEHVLSKTDSVGLPLVGWDVGVIDADDNPLPAGQSGEIVAFSSFLMPEYYKLPDKTEEVMWKSPSGRTYLKTGDMGKLDEDGFLYILDRKKDMIISGGINIFAVDIEEVLSKHPDVSDCAVIGVPHEKWGETPLALVLLAPGATATEEAVKEWLNPQLAKYQRVQRLEFRTDLPRNAMGKVLKRELRTPYWEGRE